MTVSDVIFKRLKEYGVKCVFLVTGGGSMYLNNSLKNSGIRYICNHHEQASSMAAEGYSRVTGELGVVCVTSGPGGTNTLTGVIGQWLDSIPVLYISGQVTQETMKYGKLRQLGDQEINIIDIVRPVTKYAKLIKKPKRILHELNKAIEIATTGRYGPVWIDIPLDVQQSPY